MTNSPGRDAGAASHAPASPRAGRTIEFLGEFVSISTPRAAPARRELRNGFHDAVRRLVENDRPRHVQCIDRPRPAAPTPAGSRRTGIRRRKPEAEKAAAAALAPGTGLTRIPA
jgi:hypothetical protein